MDQVGEKTVSSLRYALTGFASLLNTLPKGLRIRVVAVLLVRVATNMLDALAVIILGYASLAVSSLLGATSGASLEVPFVGEIQISDRNFVAGMGVVLGLFILKSSLAVWLTWMLSVLLARAQKSGVEKLVGEALSRKSRIQSVSTFQTACTGSISAMYQSLSALVVLISEVALILILVGIMLAAESSLALLVLGALAALFIAMNLKIQTNIQRQGRGMTELTTQILEASSNISKFADDINVSKQNEFWTRRIGYQKMRWALLSAKNNLYLAVPRYLVELLVLVLVVAIGFWALIAGDVQDSSFSLGVLGGGILKIVSSILPIQGALTTLSTSKSKGELAMGLLQGLEDTSINFGSDLTLSNTHQTQISEVVVHGEPEIHFYEGKPAVIYGPSGSGKTTFLRRFAGVSGDPIQMTLLDSKGQVVEKSEFSYVGQNPGFLKGSLGLNLFMGEPVVDFEFHQVYQALEDVGLQNWVETCSSLEELFEMQLPALPSGGESQRLALARFLIQPKSVIVLDEPTSNLDEVTEGKILSLIKEIARGRIVIFSSHSPGAISSVEHRVSIEDLPRSRW